MDPREYDRISIPLDGRVVVRVGHAPGTVPVCTAYQQTPNMA